MIVTFIGMSGSAKSYWSKRLSYEAGFRNFYCDDLIEQKLRKKFAQVPGSGAPGSGLGKNDGIGAVAEWLGYPGQATFAEREQAYLAAEGQVMEEILASLALGTNYEDQNFVIDTSGSVIYTSEQICQSLRNQSVVVYLKIPEADQSLLLEQFLNDPKPVLWRSHYCPDPGESEAEALRRCYPQLLAERVVRYEALAHVTIELPLSTRQEMSTASLLANIHRTTTPEN